MINSAFAPRKCVLCPRQCGVNRAAGVTGRCRAGNCPLVYRYGLHHGEEPVISGTNGSGTVFFSHCTLECCYCQNHPWSQDDRGEFCPAGILAQRLDLLRSQGGHNWNMVSPTPWLPWIEAAVGVAAEKGTRLPVVMNTSGYERVETLERYAGLMDIYLADLRYADAATARNLSGAEDYPTVARSALRWMWQQAGPLRLNAEGIAQSGMICRVLIIPGYAAEAEESLTWIRDELGAEVAVSVMAQYTPAYQAAQSGPPLNRRVSAGEYERVAATVERLGFEEGWMQDFDEETDDTLIGYKMPAGGMLTTE